MECMQWSETNLSPRNGPPAPALKNHSVTHFNGYLYCFGGYDGQRNHHTLLLYSLQEQRWMIPLHCGNAAVAAAGPQDQFDDSILVEGNPPPGRNGHSATLVVDPTDPDQARILILGGWLGAGPLAASDMHVLQITNGGRNLHWSTPHVQGTPPGPCNMHSADYIPHRQEVYVFRGGNGQKYLNDLHACHTETFMWRKVVTNGAQPKERANHSSAYLEETAELFVFGGWNGLTRLNDIHVLDTHTSTWTTPMIGGIFPHPRAGMTLTALRGRLYLFGGSGTSSKCLQVLDRQRMAWLDITHQEDPDAIVPHDASMVTDNSPRNTMYASKSIASNQQNSYMDDVNMSDRDTLSSRNRAFLFPASPNPNDEDNTPTVLVTGTGPGRRAGHTATAVNRQIFVFGGSRGSDYLRDFYVLDTDPPPRMQITQPTSLHLIQSRLGFYFNNEEFSDVTFIVQGKRVYGHKMVLSIVSDCFRAMFTAGFRESDSVEIDIPDCSYDAFLAVMQYIYTGTNPPMDMEKESGNVEALNQLVDILELADRFFLDNLKEVCETLLRPAVQADSYEYLLQVAQKTNALQLQRICEHFQRNRKGRNPSPVTKSEE